MKKKIRRLFIKDNGSVSVYAIIIILPIFLLNALLIDTLRILTAERQIESAMESALRSTMAEFSSELAGVGLFAYDGGDAGADFNTYMTDQFYSSSELSGFQNLSKPTITNATASFDNSRNLVDYNVFKHQVIESMKYQAPVQMGKDIFELLTGHDGVDEEVVNDAEELVENYEEILNLMKKRNKKIDQAKGQIDQYLQIVKNDIKNNIIGTPVTTEDDTIPAGINSFQELAFYNSRYKELTDKEEPTDDEKTEIKNYEDGLNLDIVTPVVSVDIYHDGIPEHLIGIDGTLNNPKSGSAKDYNDEINEMIGDSEMLEELKEFTLTDDFFSEILDSNDRIYEEIIDKALPEGADYTNPGVYSVGQLFVLFYTAIEANSKTSAEVIIQTIENKIENLITGPVDKIEKQMQKYKVMKDALNSVDVTEEEEKADESFADLWAELNKYADIKAQIDGDNQIYSELDSIIAEYNGIGGKTGDTEEPSRLQFISDAFDRFKEFAAFVSGFPESVRNELYINEYILANYGTQEPYELGTAESYAYSTKQAQYITYGYNVAGMNYFMFLKDIVLIMFIGNLISQGLQGGFAGFVGFFKAIAGALIQTADDIRNLTSGPDYKVLWSPFKIFGGHEVTVTMPMFLRIILAMKSTGEPYNNEKMRRLQAVVTKETGVNLSERPSYIEGNVEGKLKLWFIPQLAEVLPGNVQGNYYYFSNKKVYSY